MNDLKTIYEAIASVEVPIEKPQNLKDNLMLSDDFAHRPYTDPSVFTQTTPPVSNFEITSTLSIAVNETGTIDVEYEPNNARKKITFESSDESVATVDKDGVVTGIKAGTATITVSVNGETDTCAVTVA